MAKDPTIINSDETIEPKADPKGYKKKHPKGIDPEPDAVDDQEDIGDAKTDFNVA
jgi:hypothetical protein